MIWINAAFTELEHSELLEAAIGSAKHGWNGKVNVPYALVYIRDRESRTRDEILNGNT